jgi:hypothetical protein
MESMTLPRRLYPSEIYTTSCRVDGQIEPFGELITFINDDSKNYWLVREATVTPLLTTNPLGAFGMEEAILHKHEIVFFSLLSEENRATIRTLKIIERLIVYTPDFVIRANFHLGGEMRVRDLFDALTGRFVPTTQAQIFPLFTPKATITPTAEMLLINKRFISLYHPEKA